MYLAQREVPVPNWEAFSTSYRKCLNSNKAHIDKIQQTIKLKTNLDSPSLFLQISCRGSGFADHTINPPKFASMGEYTWTLQPNQRSIVALRILEIAYSRPVSHIDHSQNGSTLGYCSSRWFYQLGHSNFADYGRFPQWSQRLPERL